MSDPNEIIRSLLGDIQKEVVDTLQKQSVRIAKLADAGLLTSLVLTLNGNDPENDNGNRTMLIAISGRYPDETIEALVNMVRGAHQDLRSENTGLAPFVSDEKFGVIDDDGTITPDDN